MYPLTREGVFVLVGLWASPSNSSFSALGSNRSSIVYLSSLSSTKDLNARFTAGSLALGRLLFSWIQHKHTVRSDCAAVRIFSLTKECNNNPGQGYTMWKLLWIYHRTVHSQTNQSHQSLSWPKLHVFVLWEEARLPIENPNRQGENKKTLHRIPQLAGRFEPRTIWVVFCLLSCKIKKSTSSHLISWNYEILACVAKNLCIV